MGGLFIAVVMFFPNGLAGIWDKYGKTQLNRIGKMKFVSSAKALIDSKRSSTVRDSK
jgi:urea transport system permease protein